MRLLVWVVLLLTTVGTGSGVAQDPPRLPERRVPGTIRFSGEPPALTSYRLEVAFPQLRFRRPTYLTFPRDGTDRLFVLEQDGVIHVFDNDPSARETRVVLDLRAKVRRDHNEEGLLGLAFHPEFARNRFLYVCYSASQPRRNVYSRFTLDAATRSTADPASEHVLLEVEQPWGNHNGGMIEFGPDGFLYLSLGDGGAANDPLNSGQDLRSLLGKILRIDVNRSEGGRRYAIPEGNPFRGATDGRRPEIWAWGLRNVWRFSFDRASGALWGGDVGQNRWEEIDILRAGKNYGWRAYEGFERFQTGRRKPGRGGESNAAPVIEAEGPYEPPVIAYGRDDGVSVTGGYVYRGQRLPALQGAYLYGDYGSGKVWALRFDANGEAEDHEIAECNSLASFGEDRDGEVYLCSFDKRIYRLAAVGDSSASRFPQRLSETGLFTDTARMTPHPSLIPYDVNVPLWSDGAAKERYLLLPGTEKIGFSPDGPYRFPAGTLFVKTFFVEREEGKPASRRRLETRVLAVEKDGVRGWTYVWDEAQRDAALLHGPAERTFQVRDAGGREIERTWSFPGRADCQRCHTAAAGGVLGFHTAQIHRIGHGGENQLAGLARLGLFDRDPGDPATLPAFPDWSDSAAPVEAQVRGYLDANCANCHRPGGTGGGELDLRAHVPLDALRAVGVLPTQGDLGVRDAHLVKAGEAEASTLWLRMGRTGEGAMPPLAHQRVDSLAVERVRQWIQGLRR